MDEKEKKDQLTQPEQPPAESGNRDETPSPEPLKGWQPGASQGNPQGNPLEAGKPEKQRPISPYSAAAWNTQGVNIIDVASKKKPFTADKYDGIFAILFLIMSYLLVRWGILWVGSGLRMGLFTLIYAGVILGYARGKQIAIRQESWFWLVMMLGCALGYCLWGALSDGEYWIVQIMFLLGTAVYWPMSLSGALFSGRADNWMPLDLIRGFFILPFGNFGCGASALKQNISKIRQGRTILGILLGAVISIPILGIVLPQLMSADIGFQNLVERFFDNILHYIFNLLLYGIMAIPTACYLYGLVAGCFHKRYPEKKAQDFEKTTESFHFLPMATVYTALGIICFVYLVFIGVQAGYLFSAFRGVCPDGYSGYAEYARKGFFELCRLAAFNGAVLLAANVFSRKSSRITSGLKAFNIVLSLLTLLLLGTAWSKMILYVNVYGLSVRRFLPCWFMAFLTICFLIVIVLQYKNFSIVRSVAVVGAVMFVVLCLINVNGIIARYNLARFQKGSLPDFEISELYDYGIGGAAPALELYQNTQDPLIKKETGGYLYRMLNMAKYPNHSFLEMTAQSLYVESLLSPFEKELAQYSLY